MEGIGVSQVFAFLPQYLAQMGVVGEDRLRFVGVFSSLVFVVGAPLVPLWGVWADKYSRKAVIIRSAIVESVVFGAVALSREPWQLALSVMLIGLQLGNTGVMLAAIRDVTPRQRLGTVIALSDAATRRVFAVFGITFLASQMTRPYVPVLVERLNPSGRGLASDIALVVGTAALAGAMVSPLGGAVGDRIGFRAVLAAALVTGGGVIAMLPFMPSVVLLAVAALLFAATTAIVSAMVFGVLATEIPAERRSATLNLVYLPLYAAGLIGPLAGSAVVGVGLPAPFLVAGAIIVLAGIVLAARRGARPPRPDQAGRSRAAGPV